MQPKWLRNASSSISRYLEYSNSGPLTSQHGKSLSNIVHPTLATITISLPRKHSTHSAPGLSQVKRPDAKGRAFIFRSSSTDPYLNLSLEHYLLQNAHPESRVLFLYVNRPCIVIGRNQNPWVECALQKLGQVSSSLEGKAGIVESIEDGDGLGEVLLVRRRSGGGAVFHDEGNLNYSVIVPNHPKAEFKRRTHAKMVVKAVKEVQKELMDAAVLLETDVRVNERNDIVMNQPGRGVLKVSGSAFKLTKGRALHHGTLLFLSPNLNHIGELLRSPAREFISARGVESVRSPVGNVFPMPRDARHTSLLRLDLERSVADVFREMYGEEANVREVPVREGWGNMVIDSMEDVGSEIDEGSAVGTEIMKGAQEIMSPEWKFEQTPGFVVSNKAVEGEKGFSPPANTAELPEGAVIFLRVKNGIVQEVEISLSNEEEAAVLEKQQIRSRLQGKKLHEISDWKAIFDGLDAWTHPETGRLMDWLSKMLPPLTMLSVKALEPGSKDKIIEHEMQERDTVKRRRDGRLLEVEKKDERLVEEVGCRDPGLTS